MTLEKTPHRRTELSVGYEIFFQFQKLKKFIQKLEFHWIVECGS